MKQLSSNWEALVACFVSKKDERRMRGRRGKGSKRLSLIKTLPFYQIKTPTSPEKSFKDRQD
ncbi:hypothetical protein ABE236_17915 [Priestia endophytica]|uniref:hypothetical protein n=1 Tax=Priestia endophytica TaxID=135735 RepID=UPI003D2DC553